MTQTIIMAIQVLPRIKDGNTSVLIDKAIKEIKQSGVKYRIGPFETVMEGNYEKLMQVIEQVQQTCFNAGADKVLVIAKIERRKEGDITIEEVMGKYGG
ncbi:MAG TPA: thiamine-binding protein [Ginsengibacter sp.]